MNTNQDSKLVLPGWHLVDSGAVQAGDKYWRVIGNGFAWIPVTVNDCRPVSEFTAVIRKEK